MPRDKRPANDSESESDSVAVSDSDASVTVLTSVSGVASAAATARKSALARSSAPSSSSSGRSNAFLEALYEKCQKESFTCKTCVASGVEPKQVTGYKLSKFALLHSQVVHAKDAEHARAAALFPTRRSAKMQRVEQLVARVEALDGGASKSSHAEPLGGLIQRTILDFAPTPSDVTESDVLIELGKFMIRQRIAPHAVSKFQDLLNAAMAYGARSRHVILNIPSRKTFLEVVIEGETGLLGKLTAEATRADGPFLSKGKVSGCVMSFDGQRDINSRDLVPTMVTSSGGRHLAAVLQGTGSKTAAWYVEKLSPIILGDYDVAAQETNTSSSGRAQSADGAASLLTSAANAASKYIFMACSDHASAEQSALHQLQAKFGVIACGDPAHAVHNTAKYLTEPFKDRIKDCHELVVLFRQHSALKEMLRKEARAVAQRGNAFTCLVIDVETRFLSSFYMIDSMLDMHTPLKNVMNHSSYQDWIDSHDEHEEEANRAKALVNNAGDILMLKFLREMLIPLIKMCRFFDAARTGSLSFVYPMWNGLTESILLALANPEYASILDNSIVLKVKETVLDCWDRFDFDVYAAAYFCNPFFLQDVRALNVTGASSSSSSAGLGNDPSEKVTEYFNLRSAFQRVVKQMVRRFPPELGSEARPQPLAEDDERVRKQVKACMLEIDQWADDSDNCREFDADGFEKCPFLPSSTWTASRYFAMRAYCARLVDACVGSTDIERLHALQGQHRTKRRNRLGYVRSHSLAFLDMYLSTTRQPPSKEWGLGMVLLQKFMVLTDEDEKYLGDMEQRLSALRATEAEEAEAEAEPDEPAAQAAASATSGGGDQAQAGEGDQSRGRPPRRQAASRFVKDFAEAVAGGDGDALADADDASDDEDYAVVYGKSKAARSRKASRRRQSMSSATATQPSLEI